ncbi:MAG TPA: TerB family tellurite resistance protein, partial [Alphaproteobacteria bacterium]|nr:TerB family tellurite resistance protein [Alphaproteobacteria bacterium]
NAGAQLDPRLAVAALLVHLAAIDGTVTENEKTAVRAALQDYCELDEDEVRRLIHEARLQDADSIDFYRFTSILSGLPDSEKREIIRMMWRVVFADGRNHEMEDNMVWRVAELIHVSTRDRTILRKQMAKSGA